MLDAVVATFLEGLEAFLVVAAALAFFRKSRRGVVAAVPLGVAAAVGVSVAGAWLISGTDSPDDWVWRLDVAAAVVVTVLAVDIARAARAVVVGRKWHEAEEAPNPSGLAWLAVFFGTVLLVSRSGMLSVLLFGPLFFQVGAIEVTLAAIAGMMAAALVSWQWSRHAHRLRPATVVAATAGVVLIFLSHLVISDILGLWQNRLWPLL
jgi:high-affinity Fe2+/Pb2+ permease